IRRLVVIVMIVNEDYVLAFKFERQTPVSADADSPYVLRVEFSAMFRATSSEHKRANLVNSKRACLFRPNSSLPDTASPHSVPGARATSSADTPLSGKMPLYWLHWLTLAG